MLNPDHRPTITRITQATTLALFATFVLSPASTLIVVGPADSYVHGREQTDWPSLSDIAKPPPSGRVLLTDALLDRLALRREAIRLRNGLTFHRLHYADTDRVVSGAPGWLFYKPAFDAWACDEHARLDHGLHRLMLLTELAEANDLPLVIANAPNKASIHPERVTGRASLYADCYARYAARFRAALDGIESPHLVDHARTLRSAARRGDAYHRTDTHWTLFEAYRALETLSASTGWYTPPEAPPTLDHESKSTDLGDQILLLAEVDRAPVARAPGSAPKHRDPTRRVLLVHDSFYEEAARYLPFFLPGAEYVNVNRSAFRSVAYETFDALIIESVEREILRRFRSHAHFSWFSPTGQWIQARMSEAAERCDWANARDLLTAPVYEDLERGTDGTLTATGAAPKLWADLPMAAEGREVCLSLVIRVDETPYAKRAARLFLEGRRTPINPSDPIAEFSYGRTVELRYGSGRERLAFVVPRSALDGRVRLDLSDLAPGTRLISFLRAETPAAADTRRRAQSSGIPGARPTGDRESSARPGKAAVDATSSATSAPEPPTSTPAYPSASS